MQPQPESIQRCRAKKNQDTVGQRHASESKNFQVEQEHQPAEEGNGSIALVYKKQVVHEDQPHAEDGGGESCSELVGTEQAIRLFHEPIKQDWFCNAQFTVERRSQAIPRLEHFASCFGVPPLVTVC